MATWTRSIYLWGKMKFRFMWWQLVIGYFIPLHLARTLSQSTPPPNVAGVVVARPHQRGVRRGKHDARRLPPRCRRQQQQPGSKADSTPFAHPRSATFLPRSERLKMGIGSLLSSTQSTNFPIARQPPIHARSSPKLRKSTPNERPQQCWH